MTQILLLPWKFATRCGLPLTPDNQQEPGWKPVQIYNSHVFRGTVPRSPSANTARRPLPLTLFFFLSLHNYGVQHVLLSRLLILSAESHKSI
jgi:hypothetical protein